ncbi:zinc knuckle-domain-containing protein [Macrophomina phaseolina]|uniref:Zinc knuckle-domain-containing protein n=1 Tax=Macrophomina phaseolina TaxID=35725 RepID=A0ABQ8GNS2_9PEZI|nr:zinc knuckle-domain-containing protein [Macrophomina phaseolina]
MFRGPSYGGRSKATPTTTCQKCLKKGHYSYECKASAQERPYVSRPSRTQQLLNPKLKPQLTSDVPNELLRKKGVADETLAKKADERGRKHSRDDDDLASHPRKRSRSVSSYSSSSVSTISTNRSPTRSPSPPRHTAPKRARRSPAGDDRKRRRRSVSSSAASYSETDARPRVKERNTRRRRSSFSPGERGRRRSRSFVSNNNAVSRSRSQRRSPSRDFERSISPYSQRARVPRLSPGRRPRSRSPRRRDVAPSREPTGNSNRPQRLPPNTAGPPPSKRERSLSPYSKRLALTQAMNMGGR